MPDHIQRRLYELYQRQLNQHVKPEIQALAKRGEVTLAEVVELRCNSWEWEHLYPAMTDEAFEHTVSHALANCGNVSSPCASYDEAVTGLLAPELLRRFRGLRYASEQLARALMPKNYLGTIEGVGAGDVASAHHALCRLLFGKDYGTTEDPNAPDVPDGVER